MKNFSKQRILNKKAFTLAEMMVIMLILSIIMAAFAPVLTRKNKIDKSGGETWSETGSPTEDIYYSEGGNNQSVLIGHKITTGNLDSRLIINAEDSDTYTPHNQIRLEYGKTDVANIQATNKPSLLIGKLTTGAVMKENSISIGSPQYLPNMKLGNGIRSIAVGTGALYNNTDGTDNIAIGYSDLISNTTGSNNVSLNAMSHNTTGNYNVAIEGLARNTTGNGNTTVRGLNANTTGNYNTSVGEGTLWGDPYDGNTALGMNALASSNAQYLTAIGYGALLSDNKGDNSNTAIGNSAIGKWVLTIDKTSNNTSIGAYSMFQLNSGNYNTAINSMFGRTNSMQASYNTAIGSGFSHDTTGSNNTVLCTKEGLDSNTTGNNNTVINNALSNNITGSNNTGIGNNVLNNYFNPSTITANDSTGIGHNSGYSLFGSGTTAIGYYAGYMSNYNTTTNSNIIAIGYFAGPTSSSAISANTIYMGQQSTMSNNNIRLNGTIYAYTSTINTVSDRRLKNIGKEYGEGLTKIQQLDVRNFTFKTDKKKMKHVGVIAQDLQKIFPNSVTKADDGYLAVRWDEMFYAMINSVKELAAKVTGVDRRIAALEKSNQELRARNKMIATRIAILQKKIK